MILLHLYIFGKLINGKPSTSFYADLSIFRSDKITSFATTSLAFCKP